MSNPDFIETKGSLERIEKVSNAIRSGIPILLEGETGTSKTRTAIVASQKFDKSPIVLNFSSQTTIEDLIGRITKDTDSWGGFSFTNGPYTKAFMDGHCLILDEINLAYENVLQCIEASLDSGKLFLEISGSETKVVNMHPNFHLIATQNPLSGRFSQKRQFLSQKFRSRFQTITFVDIQKDELFEIATGLAKDLNISNDIIQKLIDFHFLWKEKEIKENQIHVFTIREISGTIKSMKEGLSPFESILIHYGSRYDSQKLEQMKQILISLGFIPTDSGLALPQINQKLFMTQPLMRSFLNSLHLLQTCHPILITGPDGCGKTAFARWMAEIYHSQIRQLPKENSRDNKEETEDTIETENINENDENENKNDENKNENNENNENKNDNNDNNENDENDENKNEKSEKKTNVFICNPEVSISDIIGRYMPVMGASGEAPIMWIDGPVIKSLKNGDCLLMDQISIAPSTILERMNSLYDNFGIKDAKFSVQENPEEDLIPIHPNFRIIATCSYDGLGDISPALLNRFTIIYMDDQLNELLKEKSHFIDFITFLSPPTARKSDIKLIAEHIIKHRHEMTMSKVSMIIKGFFSLKKIPNSNSKSILTFCVLATSNQFDISAMDDTFIQILLTLINEDKQDSAFDTFLIKEAESTRKIMATLVAAAIAGFHVVLIGKTGLGKTSAAIALSRLFKYSQGRQFISFNGETQLEELFGFFTIDKGNFTSHSGPLSDAMENGKIFIADELNLADQVIIQSLNVAIEPSKDEEIILPVIGKNIVVNDRFFFIGCQNDISMYGRKQLPETFRKKVLCINYPENSFNNLNSLTKTLAQQIGLDQSYSFGITAMIENMKKDPVFKKKIWSLREVRKLFRRTSYLKNNSTLFKGFSIYDNAAFLLRSAFRDIEGISEKVAKFVKDAFNLDQNNYSNLLKNLNARVNIIKTRQKTQVTIIKNRLSLSITNSELLKVPETLQSFWETLFEVSITHPTEPLLFVGPSGFKTFLAKIISPRAPVVYLHSDTTISSLIGQITLLDKDQARQFLLDSLYNFAGPAPMDEFQQLFNEIRESEVIDIDKIKEVLKYVDNPSFTNIVENVIQQLIDIDYTQQDSNLAFSNYLSIFKPGLITKYILKQNSLILRNIAQPSPTVLERLNELLSVKPTLTLFEDTSNTFTQPNDKILSKLSSKFRIIGICLPREKKGLSEAMLSRLTEISVPKYTNEDQEKVIDSILLQSDLKNDKSINLYKELLKKMSQIFIEKKETLSMTIPFVRIIEIVRIAIEWRKFFSKYDRNESEEILFSLALFRNAAGPLPFNNKKIFIEKFFNEESGLKINDELKKIFEDKPEEGERTSPNSFLMINEDEDKRIIQSSLSNCFIPTPLNKLPESNICFTSSIKDLIDTIMSASIINYPLILEGPNGSGKSSAIFYLSKCVDANIVRILISSSTTVEDLFGKYEPSTSSESLRFDFQPTDFLNAIRSDRKSVDGFSLFKKQWIIIEELHLASTSVLDSLAPIFNKQTDQIFLPDGTIVSKGEYFIVALTSQPLQNQSIINTSMIYKTRDYTRSEYEQIYKFILSKYDFGNDISSYFSDQMFTLTNLSSASQFKIPVTVREVYKFLTLLEGSEGKMDIEKIIRILCLGRFSNNESVESAKAALKYNDDNYKLPDVSTEIGTLISGGIPMRINTSASKRAYEIQYLSSSEKELFVFLSMALKKYTPIVIQGPTASGKTYSMQLYADIVGKPLHIIQLNSEITSQTISGTFQPSKNLSSQEMDELQEVLQLISSIPNLPLEFSSKIERYDIKEWLPNDFKKLRSILQKMLNKLNQSDQEKASLFIKKVDNLLQFYNHLKRSDSIIIKTMIEGSWLLLDGIEAAPSDFFDRLSTLIDDKPLLNLYERGNGFIYSYDSINPERRIHPDFRLIMTYNPVDTSSLSSLSSSLMTRCTVFSMKAIDNNLIDSSLIIFGLINQIDFKELNEDPSELSIKLGKTHMAAKEFTSNSQFSVTGRTLIHLCRNIDYKSKSDDNFDYSNLKDIICINYGSLMSDLNKFKEAIDDKFEQMIEVNILEFIKKAQPSASKGCNEIINLIDNFISALKENIQTKFDFETFLHWLLQIHLKDIEMIHDKIHYTLINSLKQLIIDIKSKNNDSYKRMFSHWAAIKCIEILVDDITNACQENFGNEFSKNMTLSSPQVQDIAQFQTISKKLRCILLLIQKDIFIMKSIPILFFDNTRNEFLSLFKEIDEKKPFEEIMKCCKQLENDENAKLFIDFKDSPVYFLDSINHFYYQNNNWPPDTNTTARMIASCLFFNDENCKYLFRGISKEFFVSLFAFLNNNEIDINAINDAFDYITNFYQLLEVGSSITLDELVSCFEERSNSDQKQFNKFFHNLRTLNNKSPIKEDDFMSSGLKQITSTVDGLYRDYNKKYSLIYLQRQKDQDAAKEFYQLIENINNRLESEIELKVPLELFVNLTLNIDINAETFAFLKSIYKSIKEPKEIKINNFEWPHIYDIKFSNKVPSFPLMDSLINYSKKAQINLKEADWMTLSSIEKNAEYFLDKFLNNDISQDSIELYQTIIKAQLLYELSKIQEGEKYHYCKRDSIIKFLNDTSNRSIDINQTLVDLAHHYELNMDKNFVIKIPYFNYKDIISLLFNPIDLALGPLFTDTAVNQYDHEYLKKFELYLLDGSLSFFDLSKMYLVENGINEFNSSSFENLCQYVTSKSSIEKHIQDVIQTLFNAYQISQVVLSDPNTNKLKFDDVTTEFNENFIDKQPYSGFYIAFHPEVIPEIIRIHQLMDDSSFPLSLFAFREYSHQSIVEIKLPVELLSSNLSNDVEELITKISKIIITNINNKRITRFSNLIGFLLDQPPLTLNTQYSEHFRDIILDIISKQLSQVSMKYSIQFIKEKIEKYILVLGSNEWNQLVIEDFTKTNNEFLKFLINPWGEITQSISNEFKEEKDIYYRNISTKLDKFNNIFVKYNNEGFFNKILDSMNNDENELQKKIKEEYIRINQTDDEIKKNPNMQKTAKAWKKYCSHIKRALNLIPEFPGVSHSKFSENGFYQNLHEHLKKDIKVFPSSELDKNLLVIIPKKNSEKNDNTVTISYNEGKQKYEVMGQLKTISIMKLPPNTSKERMNLQSKDVDFYFYQVFTDPTAEPIDSFKGTDMENDYNYYCDLLKESDKQFGKIKVNFHNHSFEEFKEQIKELGIKDYKEDQSLKCLLTSSIKLLDNLAKIENYFPISFENQIEIPTETTACLDQFKNFMNQTIHDLSNVNIPQELIDAEDQIVINKKSEFQKILSNVQIFAKKTKPDFDEGTTPYNANEFIIIKSFDKLAMPTIFIDENDKYILNINHLSAKFGPYMKGVIYSKLKIKIINLTKHQIECKYFQDNSIIDLEYENENGFFNLVFPIEKVVFDYNDDTMLNFSGRIEFYEKSSTVPFKEMTYDISLYFVSPKIYFNIQKYSFAIKDGEAQILPFYSIQGSHISICAIPRPLQVKLIELPNNTLSQPKTIKDYNNKKNNVLLSLPMINEQYNHLEMQIDFGLSNTLPAPITCKLDLETNDIFVAMYCDKRKDFSVINPFVTVGNMWRELYILIDYFNPNDHPIKPIFSFKNLISEDFEIKQFDDVTLEPYSRNLKVISFQIRLNKKPKQRTQVENSLEVSIGKLKKTINFSIYMDYVFADTKRNLISTNTYLENCSYWNGNEFIDYKKNDKYNFRENNLIVSSVCYELNLKDSVNLVSVKYDYYGEFDSYDNNNRQTFEVLVLYLEDKKIEIIETGKLTQKNANMLKLFARIKGKPDTVFPLFGKDAKIENNFDYKNQNLNDFIDWFQKFLPPHDKNKVNVGYNMKDGNEEFVVHDDFVSTKNFGYLILSFAKHYKNLPYVKLVNEIKTFLNSDQIYMKYNEAKKNNLESKFISIVWAIYEIICVQFEYLIQHHFIVDFPISNEMLLNEQNRLLKKSKIDKESMFKKYEFTKRNGYNKIDEYNNSRKNEFEKGGYIISPYAKWTFENQFQTISETEFNENEKDDKNYNIDFKEEITPKYSDDAGIINIPDVSFDDMNTISNTYKAFNSILMNTYQFTISVHSCLKKHNQKQITHNVKILNQLVSFYLWVKEIKDYSPYPSFFNKFFSAYQSMTSRLESAGMTLRNDHKYQINMNNTINDDFIERPSKNKHYDFTPLASKWTQPGINKKVIPKKNENKLTKHNTTKPIVNPKPLEEFGMYSKRLIKGAAKNSMHYNVEVNPQISLSTNPANEIPNQEYIDFIFNKMINPSKEKIKFNIFNDDKTHIPLHYDMQIQGQNKKVDYFFNVAENLSGSILEEIGKNSVLFDKIDNCYASILIDCSNTFSLVQKASLILLTISYGNALTALRIPYSIVIYCDDNFQFILKKLEDNHNKLLYLKLIESMTVNRRMSSMSDAIQMAKLKVTPSPDGPYSKRTNHVIYTLSDGLSTSLSLTKKWCENVLNDNLVTVSFFFLSIISEERLQDILKIWSKFTNKISKAKSPTTVFYSTYENILSNKEFFNILVDQNQNDNSLIKAVSLSECFSFPIIQSISKENIELMPVVSLTRPVKKLESFELDTELLTKILDELSTTFPDETKYYKDDSDMNQIDEPLDVDIPSIKIEPFCTNLIMNHSSNNIYNSFHTELYNLSSLMIEQSNVQEMSSFLFVPNKPSQYAPSSDGTLFYFPGLIRFLLTQGQDTKIFLEKKAGLTKSYSIFVVIDCTKSCFNEKSSSHAIQSIFILLQTISKIDLPSFNLIITTNEGPRILCCEKSTFDALSINSPIWVTLFSYFLNPHEDSYLDSALISMLSIRIQQKTLSSVLFLFTDGNFSSRKQRKNNSILELVSAYNVESITIGIGSISSNINTFSTKKVWSINPRNIVKAILSAFGKETSDLIPKITSLFKGFPINDYNDVGSRLSSCLEYKSIDDYLLKELVTELNSITRNISVFTDFYNLKNDGGEVYSEDQSHDIGRKNAFKGIKVLICQFWDASMSYNENKNISKEVLMNGTEECNRSVINSLKEFGIETSIVQNYRDAIFAISSGEFSEVWVICSRYDGRMPDKSRWANLASQFIDTLITYWNNGGGIVFWTDNSPLNAEVNFFLSKAKFENDETMKFRIGGSYPGNKYLRKSQQPKRSTFTAQPKIQCDGYEKWLFNSNMKQIFEGKTIASAIIPPENAENERYDDPNINYRFANGDDIYPFRYFSISSSGGISSLYYNSPLNSPKGGIVIDCGFSKLFFELIEDSIHFYVRNIAIFMVSVEKKMSMLNGTADPTKFKPKKFDVSIKNEAAPSPKFYQFNIQRAVDIVFLIDGTGSMEYLIEAVINSCNDIAQHCNENFSDNSFRYGAVIYRDASVNQIKCDLNNYRINRDEPIISNLKNDINQLKIFLENVKACGGGGDGPEDWLSGYQALKRMNWIETSEKIVIHIANAPAHGYSFNGGDFSFPSFTDDDDYNQKIYYEMDAVHDKELPKMIEWVADRKIRLFCLSAGRSTVRSFNRVKEIYKGAHGKKFSLTQLQFDYENIDDDQKNDILKVVKNIALNSVDSAVAVESSQQHPSYQPIQLPQAYQPMQSQAYQLNQQPQAYQPMQRPPAYQPNQQPQSEQQPIRQKPSKSSRPTKYVPASTYFVDEDDD